MKSIVSKKHIPQLLTAIVYLFLLVAVVILMQFVQNLLNSDAKINLTEVVTQNKDVITSRLNLEVNNVASVSERLGDRLKEEPIVDNDVLKKVFNEYSSERESLDKYFVAGTDGTAYFPDGSTVDISGRKYFKLSMEGLKNVSDRLISRRDGEEVFIFSVPLKRDGVVVGTLQKFFTPDNMYDICSISLFSEAGYMYIINREGYILISSQRDKYSQETENYFRLIYAQDNQNASKQIQQDVEQNRPGFMETVIDGNKTFSAYTPLEDIHDWFLISSVATSAVSPNGAIVIKLFYFILFVVVAIFAASMFGFLSYKNKQQANLERVAFLDSVTQGETYTKFLVDVQKALSNSAEKRQYYLLKFDIDNFKYVNNFYGFDFGDRILRKIYQSIDGKLSSGEHIARIYSDHFVLFLENAATDRLNDLLASIQQEEGITVYFSAGLYTISNPAESVNLMVDKASTAAATAKGSLHRKIAFYSEEYDRQMIQNEQLKRAVEQALSNGEIIPFFQPKVDINSGKMVGAEALARWRTKEGKLIPPFEFIPLCEKTGLITELDMSIYEQVLVFQKKRLDAGLECIPISVNFSRVHLLDSEFFEKVEQKIESYQVPPRLIELELTESAIFENYETISELIARLHQAGFVVSMDDFGSGYSSLNMLKDISIDVLKIDKEFLNKTTNSERQRIIFSAIAQMASQLDIKVVVEGVEDTEHLKLMKKVGCSIAQGYYYAKPMDETSFSSLAQNGFSNESGRM